MSRNAMVWGGDRRRRVGGDKEEGGPSTRELEDQTLCQAMLYYDMLYVIISYNINDIV